MHEYDNDGNRHFYTGIVNKNMMFKTQTASRYTKAKNSMILNTSFLQLPHYLECYYVIQEHTSINDFK